MGEMINWMGGWPLDGLMSQAEWEERVAEASARSAPHPDGEGQGRERLEKTTDRRLAERIAAEGWLRDGAADPEGVAATAGADAAVDWVARRWLRPGDTVLAEQPTGRSALHLFRKAGAVVRPVPSDASGMLPEELAAALARLRPRLVYAAPACTDPEGRSWSPTRVAALLESCREAGAAVLLDDRQALLRYGEAVGGMEEGAAAKGSGREASPDARKRESDGRAGTVAGGTVFTVGELPPGTIAGVRLGWLAVCADAKARRSVLGEEGRPPAPLLVPSEAERRAWLALMEERGVEPLAETLRFVCRARIEVLTELLRLQDVPNLAWQEPKGGMHLWLRLPAGLDGDALLRAAWRHGLLFQPGSAFYAVDPDRFRIRVTAVHSEEQDIRAGVLRLREAMADFLGRLG